MSQKPTATSTSPTQHRRNCRHRHPHLIAGATDAALSTVPVATEPFLPDTGATHVLLRKSPLPSLRSTFKHHPLPSLELRLPNLMEPAFLLTVPKTPASFFPPPSPSQRQCYICDDDALAHNLVGASPLIGHDIRTCGLHLHLRHLLFPRLSGSFSIWIQTARRRSLVPPFLIQLHHFSSYSNPSLFDIRIRAHVLGPPVPVPVPVPVLYVVAVHRALPCFSIV